MIRKICFVGLDNYPVLNPTFGDQYFGGESVQQTLLAKAFVELGYDVSMVVKDIGQKDGELIQDIKIWKAFKEGAGLPVVRFLYPNITKIVSALSKANADVYFQSCAGALTGVVAWFCKNNGKLFIYRTASDTDCLKGKQLIRFWRDRKLYEYGIRKADIISVQGVHQQNMLQDNYQLDSNLVNMAVESSEDSNLGHREIDVLWVNNMRPLKRPEIFIDIAKALPKYNFVMIGGPLLTIESYYHEVAEKAQQVANLRFLGPVPYTKVNSYFESAKLFINTSEIEGFPNSFLQAWVRSVPTISFFDPDNIIKNMKIGYVPFDQADMQAIIVKLLSENELREEIGATAQQYAIKRYSPQAIARYYEMLINAISGNSSSLKALY